MPRKPVPELNRAAVLENNEMVSFWTERMRVEDRSTKWQEEGLNAEEGRFGNLNWSDVPPTGMRYYSRGFPHDRNNLSGGMWRVMKGRHGANEWSTTTSDTLNLPFQEQHLLAGVLKDANRKPEWGVQHRQSEVRWGSSPSVSSASGRSSTRGPSSRGGGRCQTPVSLVSEQGASQTWAVPRSGVSSRSSVAGSAKGSSGSQSARGPSSNASAKSSYAGSKTGGVVTLHRLMQHV
ncbi:unnamed protein product, partial [Polarella glacialis]